MTSSANILGENSDEFYDAAPLEPHLLYQGEILVDVPFLDMPKPSNWLLLRTKSGRRVDEALAHGTVGGLVRVLDSNQSREAWEADGRGDFAMALLQKGPVLVLNTTCDLQNKHFMQIAPIFPAGTDATYLGRLRNDEIISAFWIRTRPPEIPQESYADLELIQAAHKSYVRRIRPEQHFRLNPEQVRRLQRAITFYFGRPNSFDRRSDAVPRAGTYLCVRCVYVHGRISSHPLFEGAEFPTCDECGGTTWILRGR